MSFIHIQYALNNYMKDKDKDKDKDILFAHRKYIYTYKACAQ